MSSVVERFHQSEEESCVSDHCGRRQLRKESNSDAHDIHEANARDSD